MTDGRFETTFNLRPRGWDRRRHWTKTHAPFAGDPEHVRDHMERESCPFHDLRADGCFQPEYAGLGVEGVALEPEKLVRRAAGRRMNTALSENKQYGVGGRLLPADTVPAGAAPEAVVRDGKNGRPWTATGDKGKLFTKHPYMSSETRPQQKPPQYRFFHTHRGGGAFGAPPEHLPDPYKDPSRLSRPAFRLRAGTVNRKTAPDPDPPELAAPQPAKKRPQSAQRPPRQPYDAHKPIRGTFSHHPTHMPEPWSSGHIKPRGWALFTYAAKTKRCMPVSSPWSTGTQAAEPVRASQRPQSATVRGTMRPGTALQASTCSPTRAATTTAQTVTASQAAPTTQTVEPTRTSMRCRPHSADARRH